jgi:hypothetical protein
MLTHLLPCYALFWIRGQHTFNQLLYLLAYIDSVSMKVDGLALFDIIEESFLVFCGIGVAKLK